MYRLLPILLFAYGLALTTDDIYDNSYALIIGIDKYENVSNLDYAVSDANSIASLLKDNFNFPSKNVKVLLNNEATYLNIRESLDEISSLAKENDRVLIFFAGHGLTHDLPGGGEMGYILPIDGKRDKLFATSIPMEDMKRISSMSQSKHMLFLIDACYGGLAATGARGLSSTTPNFIDKITSDKSRQIITAGGRGEQVIEKSEWGHSAFTMNLIRALKDGKADFNYDGFITADELGLFLKDKVSIDSGNQQTPQSRRYTSHEGEFVFVYSENTVVIQDKSTDAKLDYLISEMEELKTQSTADKTKPDLKVNPDKQQFDKVVDNTWDSDHPLVFRFVYIDETMMLGVQKHYEDDGILGLIYGYHSGEGKDDFAEIDHPTYGDYVKSYTHWIGPVAGRRLLAKSSVDSWHLVPTVMFGMGIMITRVENQDLGISEVTDDFYYALSLYNRFQVTKTIGFSLGVSIGNEFVYNFDGDNKLYTVYQRVNISPLITIDITNPFSKKKD